jgi:hypothetical protein
MGLVLDMAAPIEAPKPVLATFYTVRSDKGRYWRSYAVQGRSGAWVDNVADAKVYTKRGPAQGMVTRFTRRGLKVELVTLVVREEG